MDRQKELAVEEWLTYITYKQLETIQGFVFYRRFIYNYSTLALPLHVLPSQASRVLLDLGHRQPLCQLKFHFTSAPNLMHPDPTHKVIVEEDGYDEEVGVMWLQRAVKYTSSNFFSHKFT